MYRTLEYCQMYYSLHTHTHTHTARARTHTHTHVWFAILVGTIHRRNGFYTVQTVFSIALHQPYT